MSNQVFGAGNLQHRRATQVQRVAGDAVLSAIPIGAVQHCGVQADEILISQSSAPVWDNAKLPFLLICKTVVATSLKILEALKFHASSSLVPTTRMHALAELVEALEHPTYPTISTAQMRHCRT